MILIVEFTAGTSLEEAIIQAKKLDFTFVKFDFNGVSLYVGPHSDVKQIENEYLKQLGMVNERNK